MTMEQLLKLPENKRKIALEKLLEESTPYTEEERAEMKRASAEYEAKVIEKFNK